MCVLCFFLQGASTKDPTTTTTSTVTTALPTPAPSGAPLKAKGKRVKGQKVKALASDSGETVPLLEAAGQTSETSPVTLTPASDLALGQGQGEVVMIDYPAADGKPAKKTKKKKKKAASAMSAPAPEGGLLTFAPGQDPLPTNPAPVSTNPFLPSANSVTTATSQASQLPVASGNSTNPFLAGPPAAKETTFTSKVTAASPKNPFLSSAAASAAPKGHVTAAAATSAASASAPAAAKPTVSGNVRVVHVTTSSAPPLPAKNTNVDAKPSTVHVVRPTKIPAGATLLPMPPLKPTPAKRAADLPLIGKPLTNFDIRTNMPVAAATAVQTPPRSPSAFPAPASPNPRSPPCSVPPVATSTTPATSVASSNQADATKPAVVVSL